MKIINLVLNDFRHDSRVLKTSRSLQCMGYEILVVAIHNKNLQERERVDGVSVHRIRLSSRSWPRINLIKLIKFLEFSIRFVIGYRREKIIHCNDLGGLFVGVFSKAFNPSQKLIYDSHEFAINDVPYQSYLSIKVKYFLEKFLIRFASQVIVVSDSIANEYSRLYKIKKPNLVLNCPAYIEQKKNDIYRQNFGIGSNQLIFLYQGGLSGGRGIEILLKTFELRTDHDCVLVCMGHGPLEGLVQNYANHNQNIFYHPAVSPINLLDYTSSADFGISFIEDVCLSYRYCLPNKLFEYLMAGLPVLTSNNFEMRRFVEFESIGIVAESNSLDGFQAVLNYAVNLNISAIRANVKRVRQKYCWEEQEKVLKELYGQL